VSNAALIPSMPIPDTKTIEIVVNGETRNAPAGVSLGELLVLIGIEPGRVAVERNREIVPKGKWNSTTIGSGDELEIVHFVGGG
jgi:thiamine biosynthesis protein ThiS